MCRWISNRVIKRLSIENPTGFVDFDKYSGKIPEKSTEEGTKSRNGSPKSVAEVEHDDAVKPIKALRCPSFRPGKVINIREKKGR
ncbi:hypothetical protein [Thermococcus sp.]|uniref:hypothetical protein n=1 Tax=Thermococcus sp. TaxID=35749 RepID=UPI0025E4736C|nr:hypothetical protein [Thermococcus sp.]